MNLVSNVKPLTPHHHKSQHSQSSGVMTDFSLSEDILSDISPESESGQSSVSNVTDQYDILT